MRLRRHCHGRSPVAAISSPRHHDDANVADSGSWDVRPWSPLPQSGHTSSMGHHRGATEDLLNLVAQRHRSLQHGLRELAASGATPAELVRYATELLREEGLKRALLHPLLARTPDGERTVERRREEQYLLVQQTARALALAAESDPDDDQLEHALQELYRTLIGHTDREELEDSPRLRQQAAPAELEDLAVIHEELTVVLGPAVDEAVHRMPESDPLAILEVEIERCLDPASPEPR